MMFCFKSILQTWIILIGFRDTNDFVNSGICKHEFKFTCRDYCRFTLRMETKVSPKLKGQKIRSCREVNTGQSVLLFF